MIQESFIQKWKAKAPWRSLEMIEQDLILSRAIVALYSQALIRENLGFKGGTALNKLYLDPPARYSEDIDLTFLNQKPKRPVIDAMRKALDPWLGSPKWRQTNNSLKFFYSFNSIENNPLKIKIEINTKDSFHIYPLVYKPIEMTSPWFTGNALVTTYQLNELMGTKLKALYQRRKARDLFDVDLVLKRRLVDVKQMTHAFMHYCKHETTKLTYALFEKDLMQKREDQEFRIDIAYLFAQDIAWDIDDSINCIIETVAHLLPGNPWKSNKKKPKKHNKYSV